MSTPFNWGEEKGLLLKEIDEKDFYKFIERLKAFLKKVMDNLPNLEKWLADSGNCSENALI